MNKKTKTCMPRKYNLFYLKVIIFIFLMPFTCSAQTDTVDNYRPYLMEGGDQVRGSYTYSRPLVRNDTLRYWLVVIDTASGVTVHSKTLNLNYNISFGIKGYGLWVTDSTFGDHWEIFDEHFKKISGSGLIVTKIIEMPRVEAKKQL